MSELTDWHKFSKLCQTCDLKLDEHAELKHKEISRNKVNRKPGHWPKIPFIPYFLQEKGVWKRVDDRQNILKNQIAQRYN